LKHAPDIHVTMIVLTFDSVAEEGRFMRAVTLVDQMSGPSEQVAALTRDELSELIRHGPMDSIEDMTHWDIARREWISREGEYVALYKKARDQGLQPIRRTQRSLDYEWVKRARDAERQEDER
jgi:hypothetical protein